jgi:monofunctional biosynthetic peptidoglycan transglycosylase
MNFIHFLFFTLMISMPPITEENEILLEDFEPGDHLSWRTINDGVMGGLSQSQMTITSEGFGQFTGQVSLENNGGFASTRALIGNIDLSGTEKIMLRVKGDGKRYSFRIRTDQYFDGLSYAADFDTVEDEWLTVEFDYADFVPTFRGRKMRAPQLTGSDIRQIGFLISDKQQGPFEIFIDWIKAE